MRHSLDPHRWRSFRVGLLLGQGSCAICTLRQPARSEYYRKQRGCKNMMMPSLNSVLREKRMRRIDDLTRRRVSGWQQHSGTKLECDLESVSSGLRHSKPSMIWNPLRFGWRGGQVVPRHLERTHYSVGCPVIRPQGHRQFVRTKLKSYRKHMAWVLRTPSHQQIAKAGYSGKVGRLNPNL